VHVIAVGPFDNAHAGRPTVNRRHRRSWRLIETDTARLAVLLQFQQGFIAHPGEEQDTVLQVRQNIQTRWRNFMHQKNRPVALATISLLAITTIASAQPLNESNHPIPESSQGDVGPHGNNNGTLSTTTGTATAPAVRIEPEYRTRIHSYVTEHHIRPIETREHIAVGTRVPADVELEAVPSEWGAPLERYRYVYSGNRVMLVDPSSRMVVQEVE
jgi:hypothetical protein